MSWQVASYLILAATLAGGLARYERSRPPARMVALVAALAALAVAGRLVFAPIPNVQATTDVVLFTGFALGAAPGFAVGALGALISNMWLGQGPWTPWEMTGWGLVGLAGAGLGVLTGRRLGRLGLAFVAALAGIFYGALLDFSVMATAGGDLSLDRYLAIAARGVPFNVAHAVGNAALALAAGPALVRMIVRYRERAEFTWRPELAAPLVAFVALLFALGSAPPARSAASALGWLSAARNADGGYGASPGSGSSPALTGWAVLGLEAAGRNPLDLGPAGRTPVDFLRRRVRTLRSTGDLERTILALEAAGVGPRGFGGQDLVGNLRSRRGGDGSYEDEVNLTAFGVLAMRSAGASASSVRSSVRWLVKAQGDDGGWGFQAGVGSDPDSTGAALQGIVAGGGGGRTLARGVRYLRRDQNPDGGWALGGSGPSNSQSTAWAIQGLLAAGFSPAAVKARGKTGLDYLASEQSADGHYRYSSSSDQTPVWVTGQALLATELRAFPLAPVPRAKPAAHRHRQASGHRGPSAGRPAATSSPSSGSSPGSGGKKTAPAISGSSAGKFSTFEGAKEQEKSTAAGPSKSFGAGAAAAAGGDGQRRLFADTGVPTPRGEQPTPPAAEAGQSSHTARDLLVAALACCVAAAGFMWWRRRRA